MHDMTDMLLLRGKKQQCHLKVDQSRNKKETLGFHPKDIGQRVEMNLLFISHPCSHESGENSGWSPGIELFSVTRMKSWKSHLICSCLCQLWHMGWPLFILRSSETQDHLDTLACHISSCCFVSITACNSQQGIKGEVDVFDSVPLLFLCFGFFFPLQCARGVLLSFLDSVY